MADVTQVGSPDVSPARGPFANLRRSLSWVGRNPDLRRIQLAFLGSSIGDWAYATAVAVWAYQVGGAEAVGIWMAVRYLLTALTAPFSSTLADRLSRTRVMVASDLARAGLIAAAAACLFLELPAAPVFVLATAAALLSTPFRVAQRALLPSLARRPEELIAANGTASTIESLSFFVGPAIAASLLGVTGVETVFLLNVGTFMWSALLVRGVTAPAREAAEAGPSDRAGMPPEGNFSQMAAGFRTLAGDRDLLAVTATVAVQTFVAGASTVFVVVMADTILGTGPRGVGYLDAVLGVGSIVGGLLAISRSARGRLGTDMAVGVLLWSAPLVIVTAHPSAVTCFAAMVLLGLGNPLVDVNMDTIMQRLVPDEVLGRVFGALEACLISTMALGALVMPFAIEAFSLRFALLAVAVPVVLTVLLLLARLRDLQSRLARPEALPLLARLDVFAALAPHVLDSLARGAVPIRFQAGAVIVREGDESDRFLVVETGLVEVTQHERVLRRQGPGEYFGEIGLLRDIRRTATVTAVEDTLARVIDRAAFLDALSGHRDARLAAESTAARRLAT